MTVAVYLAMYLGLAVFMVGCIRRVVQYATMPIHLRWELYPVPHEEPSRVAHGGSYFETTDWWTRPSHYNLRGELGVMVPEMVFLKGLWEFNRKLWYASYLFHAGLYLTIASLVLVVGQVAISAVAASWATGGGVLLAGVYRFTGYAGFAMTLAGAMALLWRRASDPQLKNYTSPADLFNLFFFILAYGVLGAGYLTVPAGAAGVTAIVGGMVGFDVSLQIGALFGLGLVLASALLAYIPFTHMAHFIAKYFTYHAVRWDDRASMGEDRMQARITGYLSYKPTWSATHMGATGEKTWAEVATANPAREVRK